MHDNIHTLIQKYFEALTTVDEERELRKMLASGRYQGEDIDEARAVMGLNVAISKKPRFARRRWASVMVKAASVAAAIIGSCALFMLKGENDQYVINGKEVSRIVALAQMQNDLMLFSASSNEVKQEITDDIESMSVMFN